MIRFGTAGWSYRDWSGVVYPEKKPKGFDPLTYLAGFFDTIEVNSTFYHPARAEVAKRWTERVAENPRFRFTAKLWRRFTHERGSAWSADEVREARAGSASRRRASSPAATQARSTKPTRTGSSGASGQRKRTA
ncbi:hypothetical protein BH23GEM4_BH23GEM4_11690 [soil metagenome]